jgi:hypothetical protein
MPLAAAIAPALIGAATAIGGAAISAHASSKATAAQNAAAAQQLAAQQANLDRITGLNQPFITGGQGAYAKLLQQFGIAPAGTAGTSPPSAPAGGGMARCAAGTTRTPPRPPATGLVGSR